MRLFVLVLAALAAAKVWTQETLFRTGAEEALIAAYGAKARQACQRQSATSSGAKARGIDWINAPAIRMTTGSRKVSVPIWEVDSPAWSARYRNPFLVLEAEDLSGSASCDYDILAAQASIAAQ